MERPNAASRATSTAKSRSMEDDDTAIGAVIASPVSLSTADTSITPTDVVVTMTASQARNRSLISVPPIDAVTTTPSGSDSNPRMTNLQEPPSGTAPASGPGVVREAGQLDPASEPSPGLEAECTADAWHRRLTAMFLVVEEGPVASGHDPVANSPSLTYVMGADEGV